MARLTAKQRKAMPKKEFAEPGKKAYPVNDKAHARLAKAMVSRFGTPSQKKQVDAKANKVLGKK